MLTRQEQLELILDYYENPRHKHPLVDAEAMVEGGNPGCGDIVKVYVKIDDGRIVASFEGEGCTISQASASFLMDEINGKTIAEALAIDHAELMDGLGKEIDLVARPQDRRVVMIEQDLLEGADSLRRGGLDNSR